MEIKEYLSKNGMEYKEFSHPEVFTCEDAEKYTSDVRGPHLKNLLVKNRKGKNFYLIIIPAKERIDIKFFENLLNEKLKFANENDLGRLLGVKPGSVSPFGLINDLKHEIIVVIRKDIWGLDFVSFHPNNNTQTLELSGKDFQRYIDLSKNKKIIY
jgi:Ala-tRNA(Pro) deacylase